MTQGHAPTPRPGFARALRHRNFQLFFGGQLISVIGTWMQSVAMSWLVYRISHSTFYLGLVGFAGQIPVFLLSLFAGVWVDQFSKRHLIIATQTLAMIQAFVLGYLSLSNNEDIWVIIALSLSLGIVNSVDMPARQAFMVEMVGREDLMNAIALNSSMVNGARIVGPALAGGLVAAVGEGYCFILNGISYIAVLVGLLAMKLPLPARTPKQEGGVISRLKEGVGYIHHARPVKYLLLLLGAVSLLGMPYTTLMPIFADEILHGGASAMGTLLGSSGLGAMTGALVLTRRAGVKGLGKAVFASSVGFGAGLIIFSVSRQLWLSCLVLFPVGFCFMVQMTATNTLIQTMTPDHLRGRVMSFYSMMFLGMAPFGSLFAGVVAKYFGAPAAVALGGVLCILVGGYFGKHLSELRTEARIILQDLGID